MASYNETERRVLAALVIEWHRPGDRLLAAEDLREYHIDVDTRTYEAIVADLKERGLVDAFFDKDGPAAILRPSGYKEAHRLILDELGNPESFDIHGQKEEIFTEAEVPEWFPIPTGWKWYTFEPKKTEAPAAAPSPTVPQRERRPINWQMWGVIVGTLTLVAVILLELF